MLGRILGFCAPRDRRAARRASISLYTTPCPPGTELVLLCTEEAARGLRRVPPAWWARSVRSVVIALPRPFGALRDVVREVRATCPDVTTVCVDNDHPFELGPEWNDILHTITDEAPGVTRVLCADTSKAADGLFPYQDPHFPRWSFFTDPAASPIEDVVAYALQDDVPRLPNVRRLKLNSGFLLNSVHSGSIAFPAALAHWVAQRFPSVHTVLWCGDYLPCSLCFANAFAPRPNGCSVYVDRGGTCSAHGGPLALRGWYSSEPAQGHVTRRYAILEARETGTWQSVMPVNPGSMPMPGTCPVSLVTCAEWLWTTRKLLAERPAWVGRCITLSVDQPSGPTPLGEENRDHLVAICRALPALVDVNFDQLDVNDADAIVAEIAPILGPRLHRVGRRSFSTETEATLIRHCPWYATTDAPILREAVR